ncbi:MAG: PAS domain S-box protein [Phycisphaerales bacterium]
MLLLIASVLLRVLALAWAAHLLRRTRDARRGFKALVLALFTASVALPLIYAWDRADPSPGLAELLVELGNLVVSVLLVLTVLFVGRLFDRQDGVLRGLMASEDRYRRLVEHCADAVVVHSDGRLVFANAAAARLLGARTPGALIGVPVIDLVHPEHRDQVRGRIASLYDGALDVVPPLEERLLRLDRRTIDAEITASACSFEGARAIQVVMRDISLRKRAEQDLLESRSVLERAQSVAHVGSWVWSPGRTPDLSWSAETFRIFGVDPGAFDGRVGTFFRCVHPDDTAKVHAASEAARAGGRLYSIDHRIIRPDGQVRWVHEEAEIVPSAGGEGFSMIGVVQDITERKLARDALEESESRYRQLFKLSPEPMWVYETQTRRFLAVNEAALAHYGYSRDEFLRMTVDDLRAPGEPRPSPAALNGAPASASVRHRRKDGTTIDAETVGQNMPFIGPSARLVAARDVTEQRCAERLRSGQGRVLELLARGAPLPEVLGQLATTYEAQIEGAHCSVHLLDERGETLRGIVAPSLPPDFLATCGMNVARRERVAIPDLRAEPAVQPWREHLEAAGIRACWSQPILGRGGAVLGTVALHFGAVREPAPRELELLESAASLAGIAVERRRGEEALREANDRLTAIIGSSPLPIIAIDLEGSVRLWNTAAAATFGWTEEEVIGRTNPIVPEDRREEFSGLIRRIVAGEPVYGLELRRRRRDGTPIDVSLSASQLHSPGGEVAGILAVVADITERKRTELALRESEERLAFAQECAEAGTWDWDIATGQVIGSEGYYRVYGVRPSGPLTRIDDWYESVVPEDLERTRAAIDGATAARAPDFRVEFRIVNPLRGVRWLGGVGRIRYDGQGRPVRMAGITIDITDRKRAEDAALEWKRRYEAAVRASRQLLYEWDPQTDRLVWGGNAEELLGVSLEALGDLGHWLDLVHPDDRTVLRGEIERLVATRTPFILQHRVRHRDGRYIDVEDTGSYYTDAAGGGRLVGLVSDITQRKRMETGLRQTQKLEAIGRLASGVAHDFNNLLTAIFGYTSLARRTLSAGHPATRSLDRVDEAARQASGVTKALLTFGRASPTDKRPLDLVGAVDSAIGLLRRTLPGTIAVRAELEPGPLWVRGDATQLQQIVMNLAINARDAMPGGGALSFRLQACDDRSGPAARLTVIDTGTGITPEVMARIFEPFFTTKPPDQGTGLGLPIIHGIVTDHGGRIDIVSEPGEGATFIIHFPLTGPAADQPGPEPAREASGHGELIILGDHHTYVREIVATMLQSMGFRVLQAGDGAGALALYDQHRERVRLLLLDEDMPGRTGWACAEAVRDAEGGAPALVMAAAEPPASGPGPANILRKPFNMGELSAAVAGALAGASAAPEPA